jgi:hypothetical protein
LALLQSDNAMIDVKKVLELNPDDNILSDINNGLDKMLEELK